MFFLKETLFEINPNKLVDRSFGLYIALVNRDEEG